MQGILSFLCAPLIGALSDVWGRKSFLLVTVFSTCAPIPLLYINGIAYFVAVALSGTLAVTFSIVFSYVADCTDEDYRSCAYGLVSVIVCVCIIVYMYGQKFIILLYIMNSWYGMYVHMNVCISIMCYSLCFVI